MKTLTAFLVALLALIAALPAAAQVTNLTVNGSTISFTMVSGDLIDWSYNLPVGATAEGEIWIDVNQNHAIDPGADRILFMFTQTDGDASGNGGPGDMDGVANGAVQFATPIGIAPSGYVMKFTHGGVGETIWGTVQPLASPAFTVSGTVTGPVGADLSYLIVDVSREGDNEMFWNGLTDSLGGYTVEMGPDTSGAPWRVRVENPPFPYTVSPIETIIAVAGSVTGIDFVLMDAAAQVTGYLIDDGGDTLAFSEVSLQRVDTAWMGIGYYTQTDAGGRFWFGVPLSVLNGNSWRLTQSNNDMPITTHLLATRDVGILGNGDSVDQDLIVYAVNSSIDGFLQIDGAPPGFAVRMYAVNSDSGESFVWTDSVTGSFSIPVSDKIYNYNLWPNNISGPYNWPFVTAHPGDAGVIYNLTTGGGGGAVSVNVAQGWNLISRPINTLNSALTAVYPAANPGYAWAFKSDSGYVRRDSLDTGRGYWAKFPDAGDHLVSGQPLGQISIPLEMGWNIVGSVDHPVPAPSGGIIAGSFWGYDAGYTAAGTLYPGKGYWVKANATGSVNVGPSIPPKAAPGNTETLPTLVIADAAGSRQSLHLATADADLSVWEMPPPPPPGAFDARFESNRMAERFSGESPGEGELRILIRGAVPPVSVELAAGVAGSSGSAGRQSFAIVEYRDGAPFRTSPFGPGSAAILSDAADHSLGLRIAASSELPTSFSLDQNYPNPFNPVTTIPYSVPVRSLVLLTVYDVLGREVATLVNEVQDPGAKSVLFDSRNLPSGVYAYRLVAGGSTGVLKMVLIR